MNKERKNMVHFSFAVVYIMNIYIIHYWMT